MTKGFFVWIICCAFMTFAFAQTSSKTEGQTVGQCIAIYNGLNALNYVGQQLLSGGPPPADAKQYKLGSVRMTVALDIAALTPIVEAARKAQAGFLAEQGLVPPKPDDKAAIAAQNLKIDQYIQTIIEAPCHVELGHISLNDLRLGDGNDQNPIPPTVLSVLSPIIDK